LIPDLCGNWEALAILDRPQPEVLNHNTETVPRLYRRVRPQGDYGRSLELLRRTRALAPSVYTKSGIMVGLGETDAEVQAVMADLRSVDCDILTIGQYLQPSAKHLTLQDFHHPRTVRCVAGSGGNPWLPSGGIIPPHAEFLSCGAGAGLDEVPPPIVEASGLAAWGGRPLPWGETGITLSKRR
jgi:hypothetical protein